MKEKRERVGRSEKVREERKRRKGEGKIRIGKNGKRQEEK